MLVAQCPTLYDPNDYSPPGSSVHGILQARMLDWVAIPFSRGSSWSRDQTRVSCIACICAKSLQSCPALCDPVNSSLPGFSIHGDSLGKNIGVGCHAQLQGIFPMQGSNPCLLNWQASSLLSEPLKWKWWLGGGRESITNCIIAKFVLLHAYSYIQFNHRFCLTLVGSCLDPMDCSMPGFPVHHQLPELTQTHVH